MRYWGISVLGFLLWGCHSESRPKNLSLEAKKQRLEQLRREVIRLQAQIQELEQELQAAEPQAQSRKAMPVSYLLLEPQAFKAYLRFQGSVDNRRVVTLTARLPAPIVRLYVQEGDFVQAGQVLLEQDAEALRKNIAEVRSRLGLAQTLYEKQKQLYEEGIGAEVQYLTAKSNKESLEAALAALEEQLRSAQVRAPFAGRVDGVLVRLGEMLMPGIPAIRLMSSEGWEIKVDIPESFLRLGAAGLPVEVEIPDIPAKFSSRIAVASQNLNLLNRAYTVVIRDIPAEVRSWLRPNMTAYVRIPRLVLDKAWVVPIEAVQFQDTSAYVYVARGGLARRVGVQLLATEGRAAALAGPLQKGDTLITEGTALVTEGQPVLLVRTL